MKGMVRALTVGAVRIFRGGTKKDVVMSLRDYNFFLSRPLTGGKHVIEVRNEGTQWHEFELHAARRPARPRRT